VGTRPSTGHPLLTTDPEVAVRALLDGGLAGLPTETVYGLAADADSPSAVARVYAAKGRPADHPLIVHLADAGSLPAWAEDVPPYARRLATALWPGPLTLVLPRTPRAGDHVTGGQDTVGLRVPAHPVARAVLAAFTAEVPDGGLAAPSANRFGRISPTLAAHVLEELDGVLVPGVDVVLDGGPSRVGVESTIVDCTGPVPVLLRPGGVPAGVVEGVGGSPLGAARSTVRAPGTLASHYAPAARVLLVEAATAAHHGDRDPGPGPTGLLAPAHVPTPPGMVRLAAPPDSAAYARDLYAALRRADALALHRVLAVPPDAGGTRDPAGLADAVRDRLSRAAAR